MADRWGRVSWPGIISPRSCEYTMSQGVAPGIALLRINPQPGIPFANEGTLSLFDGTVPVNLPGCKIDQVKEKRTSDGVISEITIFDRRWKWRECGAISLWANQLDPQSKFIPWSVASPVEIATRCLQNMGETRFVIDLPTGLTSAQAAGLKEFLPTGVHFPPSGVNPPIDWTAQKPMLVLEQLAEMFGRVVVWRWDRDEVWVIPKGSGGPLPEGSISSSVPGVDVPKAPDGICVVGAPTRYQCDFELMAVGEEWDGRILPINNLSYAPQAKVGVFHQINITGDLTANFRYYVVINGTIFQSDIGSSYAKMADLIQDLQKKIDADPTLVNVLAATLFTDHSVAPPVSYLRLKARQAGVQFEVSVYTRYALGAIPAPPEPSPPWFAAIIAIGRLPGGDWSRAWPPLFPGVRATDRLTLSQARNLARKSVWRYYQLSGRDASGKGPINVPGFGSVQRYQVILQNDQCEQIVPEKPDFKIRLKGNQGDGQAWVQNFYNGLSKSKPAACFGSILKSAASHLLFVMDEKNLLNTGADEQVQVDFAIDPTYQTVKFSGPVYKVGTPYAILEPTLTLRTACYVRDAGTNAPASFQITKVFGGGAGQSFAFERHDDIQLNVIPSYDKNHKILGINLLEADPLIRGQYYLDAMLLKYQVKPSLVNVYNGIMPIQLDGAITQITWNVSGDPGTGTETTASLNHEHSTNVPPFPMRRRTELLRAAVGPGEFLGQVGKRADPTQPVFFTRPPGG